MATPRLTAFLGSGPPARLRLASAHCRLNEPVFVEEEGLPEPSKEAVSKSVVAPTGDRQFESPSLQRRVCELSVSRRRTLVLVLGLGWSAIAQIPKLIGRELESIRCVRASCMLAPEPTAANWPPGCTARQERWFGRLRARLLTVARLGSHEIDGLLLLHPHEQPAR